jgi:NAD-dependent deacetylase
MTVRLKTIFVLTGAGVSAESGLGTFRDSGEMWAKFDPLALATPEAFALDPEKVNAFYNLRRANLLASKPNPAHDALARLESALEARGGTLTLVTQNVDDLHERAGSRRVVHMHGELLKTRCAGCQYTAAWRVDIERSSICAGCGMAGRLRPDVIWFGEIPYHYEAIHDALLTADLFVSIGTSGAVYPAAGLVAEARARGIATLELNLAPSDGAALFDEARYGPASEVVPKWVEEVA